LGRATPIATSTDVHGGRDRDLVASEPHIQVGRGVSHQQFGPTEFAGAPGILNFSGTKPATPSTTPAISQRERGLARGQRVCELPTGQIDTASVHSVQDPHSQTAYGLFFTDNWKVTPKLTMSTPALGLGKLGTRNLPSLGRVRTEHTQSDRQQYSRGAGVRGQRSGTLQLPFHEPVSYAIGPRFSAAYQITPKTIFRGGAGVNYAPIPSFNYITNAGPAGRRFNQLQFNNPGERSVFRPHGEPGLVYDRALLNTASLNPDSFPPRPRCSARRTSIPIRTRDALPGPSWSVGLQREV